MNDLFDRTDEELVALYAEGNNGAFDVLLKRHQVRTFNYIYYIVMEKKHIYSYFLSFKFFYLEVVSASLFFFDFLDFFDFLVAFAFFVSGGV